MGLLRGDSLETTYDKVLVTILRDVDGITLSIDVGTELGSLDRSFDGSNESNHEGLLL